MRRNGEGEEETPRQMTREETIKERGLTEHILCAWPWSRKRLEMGL